MTEVDICPVGYLLENGECYHTLWPFTFNYLIGTIILIFSSVLSSMAGLGGGGIIPSILIMFFDYLPKDATIVVFCCITGTSLGNISNLLQDSVNGKPLIQYQIVFISIPLILIGAIIGVIINKFLPSVLLCIILIVICLTTTKKTYLRFKAQHQKQNQDLLSISKNNGETHQRINPFRNQKYLYIYKHLGIITILTMLFSFSRGSSKMPSIIGIQPCSMNFFLVILLSFVVLGVYAYKNLIIVRKWNAPKQNLSQEITQSTNLIDDYILRIVICSIGGGIWSGLGLGGGLIIVPMYRYLGCSSLQTTASCAVGIFIASFTNCMQGISIGVIQFKQLAYFGIVLCFSSFFLSKWISRELKKRNRFSYITGLFLILVLISCFNIPLSVYGNYVQNGYDKAILFGFGSIC